MFQVKLHRKEYFFMQGTASQLILNAWKERSNVDSSWSIPPSSPPHRRMLLLDSCFYSLQLGSASCRQCRGKVMALADTSDCLLTFLVHISALVHLFLQELICVVDRVYHNGVCVSRSVTLRSSGTWNCLSVFLF
ncbi:hypothetical protein KC19_2G198700 [Ceratodon purpureus]|uniref:Uncharacterized protein n=1 Tax=Ceratodon purpureus TaxID=3225 RepID=A0A8T0IZU2_CERPU|nr:hypothetical protein KC19_2G198700 [Ceratodon purpureus]